MKRFLVCLVIAATAIAGCNRDPKVKAQKYAAAGDSYVAQKKYKEAILEYRNALAAQPTRADLHYKLAKAYMETGDPVKAYGSYSQAADLDPSNLQAPHHLGEPATFLVPQQRGPRHSEVFEGELAGLDALIAQLRQVT